MLTTNFSRLLDSWSLPIMILDRDLRFVYANPPYLQSVHKTLDEVKGLYVFEVFEDVPERTDPILEKFRRTLDGEVTRLDEQPFSMSLEDGSREDFVWQATQDPIRDEDGKIVGLIQRAEDITERYELEQRNKAIGYELSHRVKNIMAMVSSVARITGRNAKDVQSFVQSFTARVNAMSRTNDLLSNSDWRGLDIGTIVEDELSPFKGTTPPYTVSGPKVRLSIDATKDLSMVCHELATNAVKYGALSHPGGHLYVDWTLDGETLHISWREKCAQTISVSDNVGFGTRLFDMLPYATVERDFTTTGLHLTITMDGENLFA
jgi:PAS domain S-box-containing protein